MEQRSKSVDAGESRSVHLAIDILELLVATPEPLGLTDIARQVPGPKATVHRLLATLQTRGYVRHDVDAGAYSAGVRCFELGSSWAQHLDLRTVAAPVLRRLNDETRETVHLAVYDNGETVYVEKLDSPLPVVAKSAVGRRSPAFCVATGRALLAFRPHQEITEVLRRPLPVYTEHTVTDPGRLAALLADVRRDGYAVNHSSYRDGVGGVAAPIRDHTGAIVAAVGCCVPEHRFGPADFESLRDQSVWAAAEISRLLGAPGPGTVPARGALTI